MFTSPLWGDAVPLFRDEPKPVGHTDIQLLPGTSQAEQTSSSGRKHLAHSDSTVASTKKK